MTQSGTFLLLLQSRIIEELHQIGRGIGPATNIASSSITISTTDDGLISTILLVPS